MARQCPTRRPPIVMTTLVTEVTVKGVLLASPPPHRWAFRQVEDSLPKVLAFFLVLKEAPATATMATVTALTYLLMTLTDYVTALLELITVPEATMEAVTALTQFLTVLSAVMDSLLESLKGMVEDSVEVMERILIIIITGILEAVATDILPHARAQASIWAGASRATVGTMTLSISASRRFNGR